MRRFAFFSSIAICAAACGPPMRPARTTLDREPSEREAKATENIADADCSATFSILLPGVAQMCQGRTAEGVTMATLGTLELGTGVTIALTRHEGLDGFSHPAAGVPLLAAQNLWAYSYADALFEEQRAARLLYVPEDKPTELLVAPFNANVMGHTDVWLGALVTTLVGVAVSGLVDEELTTSHLGEDANLFGRTFRPGTGYPLAGGIGAGLFMHVAIGEESVFRGVLMGEMSREADPTAGWIGSSVVFGAAHSTNALALPNGKRERYIALGVPTITVLGSYLGLSYRWHDYSLAAPVAIHFWYDFLLSATFFVLDPKNSPLAAGIRVPF